MRYNNNREVFEDIKRSAIDEYCYLAEKSEKIRKSLEYKGTLDETLTSGTTENKVITAVSSIPSAIQIAIGVAGITIGMISSFPVLNNLGREVGLSQQNFLSNLSNFAANTVAYGGDKIISGIKLLAIPATFSAVSLPKKFLKEHKLEKLDEMRGKMKSLRAMTQMLDDLNNNIDDPSLVFQRKFLSGVDLTKNNRDFNFELIYSLAMYRDSILRQKNRSDKPEDTKKSYSNFIEVLCDAKGASRDFYKNYYVRAVIGDYFDSQDKLVEYSTGRAR